jgi:hypothetical protein
MTKKPAADPVIPRVLQTWYLENNVNKACSSANKTTKMYNFKITYSKQSTAEPLHTVHQRQ